MGLSFAAFIGCCDLHRALSVVDSVVQSHFCIRAIDPDTPIASATRDHVIRVCASWSRCTIGKMLAGSEQVFALMRNEFSA